MGLAHNPEASATTDAIQVVSKEGESSILDGVYRQIRIIAGTDITNNSIATKAIIVVLSMLEYVCIYI